MNNELKMNKSLILIISVWSNVLTPCPPAEAGQALSAEALPFIHKYFKG